MSARAGASAGEGRNQAHPLLRQDVAWLATYAATALTLLSQTDALAGLRGTVVACAWGGAFLLALASKRKPLCRGPAFPSFMALGAVLYFSFYALLMAFGVIESVPSVFMNYFKMMLVYLTGYYLINDTKRSNNFKVETTIYTVGAIILAVYVYINYFPNISQWMQDVIYAYDSKNSTGQLLAIAIILNVALLNGGTPRVQKLTGAFTIAVCLAVLVLIQCRASIFGLIVAFAVLCLLQRRYKLLAACMALLVLLVLFSPSFQALVYKVVFRNGFSSGDLNTFSSGRFDVWARAWASFQSNPLFGNGTYYVDNFYICVLANGGVFLAALMYGIWAYRVALNLKAWRCGSGNRVQALLASLTAFYLVGSMLEGHPPFGPGACSFLFWLLCGLFDASSSSGSPAFGGPAIPGGGGKMDGCGARRLAEAKGSKSDVLVPRHMKGVR